MYYLAIDIGASSGRHILGEMKNGRLETTEVYRFENGFKEQNGTLIWDIEKLTSDVVNGIAECKKLGKIPETVAIDTWGVDYVLFDNENKEILPCVSYRDSRTAAAVNEVFAVIPKEELYAKTGIQTQAYNTIFQLWCDKKSGKLQNATRLLMMPEYLSYRLTGVMKNEYTNASTTGLVNAENKVIDKEICARLGINAEIFGELNLPSTYIGSFTEEIKEKVGFDAKVIFCPSHDTASAVAACPVDENSVFISSGTWSLVGTENLYPVTTPAAMEANFSNEGGINYRFRFLKNIMGMWLFQNIRKNLDKKFTYDEMMQMAMESSYDKLIDPTDDCFLAPENMVEAIRAYLGESELPIGDVLKSVYISLATSYKNTVEEIEQVAGKKVNRVAIVGGGSKDAYLNKLTKEYTGRRVTVGPTEGTAIGNLIAQLMYVNKDIDLSSAREIVINTFDIQEVE
ncbi:MAG: rhamnulokinase [Ruminococcaceae bacterium]|nr:rhamnulokinase [Oscillospiraceae bacterium]